MGDIKGVYSVVENKPYTEISLNPSEGWRSVPNSAVSKFILSSKSIFCQWPKNYHFRAKIDLNKQSTEAKWFNKNIKN